MKHEHWEEVMKATSARGTALLVVAALAHHADDKTRLAWPSWKLLMEETHLDKKTLWRALARLEETREIVKVKPPAGHEPTRYFVARCSKQDQSEVAPRHRSEVADKGSGQVADEVAQRWHTAISEVAPEVAYSPREVASPRTKLMERQNGTIKNGTGTANGTAQLRTEGTARNGTFQLDQMLTTASASYSPDATSLSGSSTGDEEEERSGATVQRCKEQGCQKPADGGDGDHCDEHDLPF